MQSSRLGPILVSVLVLSGIIIGLDVSFPQTERSSSVAAVATSIPAGYTRTTPATITKDVVPANDENARLTWWESYTQMGLINYFRATKNVAFLDELIRRIDLVIAARDDNRKYGTRGPVWSSTRYTAGTPYPTLVSTGMITRPMAEIASIIKADPGLAAGTAPDGRMYGTIADSYILAAAQAVAFHEKEWRSDLTPARYVALPETSGYFRDSQGRPMSDAYAVPYNMENALGRTIVYLYQATGNAAYKDRAVLLARHLSAGQYISGGALVWKYWDWSEDPSVEDTSHAWISIDFMRLMYQSGLYFDDGRMAALLATFHQNVAPSPSVVNNIIDGTEPISGEEREFGAMWAVLSSLDKTIAAKAKQIATGNVLTTWRYMVRSLGALDESRKADGTQCTLDTECKSDMCFGGKICGARLGVGSSCTRDVECASSACTSGKCAAPLSYGSSCTRDTQCASKICYAGKVCGNPLSTTSTCTRDIECGSGVCASGTCAATRSVASSPITAAARAVASSAAKEPALEIVVTTDSATYEPGQAITVSWKVKSTVKPKVKDWVGVVNAGREWGDHSIPTVSLWKYTSGAVTGSATLVAPSTVGTYEIAYFLNDSKEIVYRSAPFIVGKASAKTKASSAVNPFTVLAGDSVFALKDDGSYISETDIMITPITQAFYKQYDDIYDFIAIYTTHRNPNDPGMDFFVTVNNTIEGIGSVPGNQSHLYGSKGTLKGVAVVRNHEVNTQMLHSKFDRFGDLSHELAHYWLLYLNPSASLPISNGASHWSAWLDTSTRIAGRTYTDPNSGYPFIDNRDGTFSMEVILTDQNDSGKRFSAASLYLMGFLPASQVSPLTLWQTNVTGQALANAGKAPGTKKTVTINELIALAGKPRKPDSANAQRAFKIAYILLTPKNETVDPRQVDNIKWVAENFPREWNLQTAGQSTIVPVGTSPEPVATNLSYGAKCSADTQCSSKICFAGKVCGNLLGNGSTCTRNLECVSDRCSSGVCAAQSPTPAPAPSPTPTPTPPPQAPVATNLPYSSACTQDAQCSSNICYAGKVCGNLLGYGSTCTRDKECGSGICYAGKVCGNPLGVGSTCTRNSECASSVCSSGSCK